MKDRLVVKGARRHNLRDISVELPSLAFDTMFAEGRRRCVESLSVYARQLYADVFKQLRADGFSRVGVDGEVRPLTGPPPLDRPRKHSIDVAVDRLAMKASA
ncbi:hypothetical protein [Streptomyces mirabilis]